MKDFPVIKFTLFFIIGIVLQSYFPLNLQSNFIILCSLIILFIVSLIFNTRRFFRLISAVLILFIIILVGYTSNNIQQKSKNFIPDSIYVLKDFTAYGEIENIDLPVDDGFSFLLKTDSIKTGCAIKIHVNLLCKLSDKAYNRVYDKIFPGNRIAVKGIYRKGREERNPAEFDYNKYLHSKNISGMVFIDNSGNLNILDNRTDIFKAEIFSIRKNLNKLLSELHNRETAGLLKGLLLADRSDINFETMSQFINAGVIHILAVSGSNVGFIALVFYVVFGRLNFYFRSVLVLSGIIVFMFITGAPASVFRAVVMAAVMIIAFLLNRTTNIYNSLALAALIILFINPSEIFDPGFQLSFSAVLSIAYFYPIIRNGILNSGLNNRIVKNFLLFCAVSVSAQIGTLPITLNYFGKLSVVAIFANLIVIPLAGIIIGTAILTIALFPVSAWISSVYANANNLFSHLMFTFVNLVGKLEYAFIGIKNYSSTDTLIFYLFTFGCIFLLRYFSTVKAKIILVLLMLTNIGLYTIFDDSKLLPDNILNVYMIDVGQGDAFLIRFPDNETALIDAGDAVLDFDNGERIVLPLLEKLGIKKIDYGFVSHIDADHYSGFVSLIENKVIKKIYKPSLDSQSEKDLRFERFLKNKNITTEYYSKKEIKIGNAVIFILNDSQNGSAPPLSSNNRSGILKIVYGNTSFLFTGDLDMTGEKYYRDEYRNFLDIDVLKVSHHGSKTGSSNEFINVTSPKIGLISCGDQNKFGHPSNVVIDRLTDINSLIFRTDKNGGVLLQSDGFTIKKITWKNNY